MQADTTSNAKTALSRRLGLWATTFSGMIYEDDPQHRRLRNLVSKAFSARAVALLSGRVEEISCELLDDFEKQGGGDLLESYARPLPTWVIAERPPQGGHNAHTQTSGENPACSSYAQPGMTRRVAP